MFEGAGTGSCSLEGDGLLGLTGNAGATVASGTIVNITIGLDLGTVGLSVLSSTSITAVAGSMANIETGGRTVRQMRAPGQRESGSGWVRVGERQNSVG